MKYLGKITDNKDLVTKEYVDGHHDSTKQDTLVSGTNIKTINNQSLLGSGNISVGGGTGSASWGDIGGTLSNQTDLQTALDNKMDKENPTGTGSFSLNRRANTTVGDYSFAEGHSTAARGDFSHTEGGLTTAEGMFSHAEGFNTIVTGDYSHVQGTYNNANTSHADIVGNGSPNARSNAYALDWDGNGHFAGDVYVGCNADSTGGTKLAKISEIPTSMAWNSITDKPSTFAPSSHTHTMSNISDFTVKPQFVVETYSEHSSKSVGTSGASATHNISKPNYYPLGIVGFFTSDANVLVRGCYLNNISNGSATINYWMRSVSGTKTVTQTTRVLWVKI